MFCLSVGADRQNVGNRGDDVGNKVLILFLLLTSIRGYAKNYCSHLFETQDTNFSKFYKNKTPPLQNTENSAYELLNAATVVSETYPARIKKMRTVFSFSQNEVLISDRMPSVWNTDGKIIPILPILTTHAVLEKALIRFGLSPNYARQLGFQIQKSIIESLNLSWGEYLNFLRPYFFEHGVIYQRTPISSQEVLRAMEQISQLVEVDFSYQVPYLAGYSKFNSKKIYIDRDMKRKYSENGKTADLAQFLIVHEAVEKILIDELKLKSNSYLATHQIAQRLEMAAVLASGISWDKYQHEVMAREIARSEDPSRKIERIPSDIDLTPYKDSKDFKLIKQMFAAMPEERNTKNNLFVMKELQPGVFYLLFKDRIELAKTMLRFQEHFESPMYRGKVFSKKEFEAWYRQKKNGKFDYYDFWGDGFNIPSHVLNAFYSGEFKNLTAKEKLILNAFRNRRHTKFYVIATAKNSETKTFEHEIAHALYYLNPEYRAEIEQVLNSIDIRPVEKFLKEFYGDYHDSVLRDEAHAWLMNNSEDLIKDGFNTQFYQETILQLQAIYAKYTK